MKITLIPWAVSSSHSVPSLYTAHPRSLRGLSGSSQPCPTSPVQSQPCMLRVSTGSSPYGRITRRLLVSFTYSTPLVSSPRGFAPRSDPEETVRGVAKTRGIRRRL